MDIGTLLQALVLGLVEGLTEFIPVSSTGHLILLGHFLGFEYPGNAFPVMIQLGAIVAILAVYAQTLIRIALALPSDPGARRFVLGVLLAFLPAAAVGALLSDWIDALLETPALVCTTLILGGVVLLFVDRLPLQPRHTDATRFPLRLYVGIGLCQCLALVPGVSRSGSTIVGALLLGADRRSAAEFSFFLAMPTMAGAFAFKLVQNRDLLSADDALLIGVGFAAAFVAAIVVVRQLLNFVARHGYAPFAWWRIGLGSAGLVGLLVVG